MIQLVIDCAGLERCISQVHALLVGMQGDAVHAKLVVGDSQTCGRLG